MWVVTAIVFSALAAFLRVPMDRPGNARIIPRRTRETKLSHDELLQFALAFRLELESGVLCEVALQQALETLPVSALSHTRQAIRSHSDVVAAMHRDAQSMPLLRDLSLAIALSQKQGSQLGHSLAIMTQSIQERIQAQQLLNSELASVRATIAVLAMLPILGIGFATVLGARPIPWMLHSTLGTSCVLVAICCEVAGVLWTRVLIKHAMKEAM